MAEKKTTGKTAPKKKSTPKAGQPAAGAKKVQKSAKAKAEKPKKAKTPGWLHPKPVDYVVGTLDYRTLIEEHNKIFKTHHNPWRTRPQVFYTIHENIVNHFKKPE